MQAKKIMIMAGGTGGHIYPALAVADELHQKGFMVYWLGSRAGLETKIVADKEYILLTIPVVALRGKGWFRWVCAPVMLLIVIFQALLIMWRIRPLVVLGMGGFVSGPGGVAAWLLGIPLLIHEQNAVFGLTNRLLMPLSSLVMVGVRHPLADKMTAKTKFTGNPVRSIMTTIPPPEERYQSHPEHELRVLVLGGSQGAKALNQTVPKAISKLAIHQTLKTLKTLKIKHQCGAKHIEDTKDYYRSIVSNDKCNYEIVAFIEDMAGAYTWADVVVSRAGALTIAELAAAGVASILIPFPYAVDDHQTKNAIYLVQLGAAQLIPESALSTDTLIAALDKISHRETLIDMSQKAYTSAERHATAKVVNHCLEFIHD